MKAGRGSILFAPWLFRFLFVSTPALALRNETESAITRVVQLLEELKHRVEKDGEGEQQVFDKFACWCETITAKKATSITDAEAELLSLGNKILELKGTVATLLSEIKGLAADILKNEESQKAATEVRLKENALFQAEKVELQQALVALQQAIVVLQSSTSLLQPRAAAKAAQALAELHSRCARLPAKVRPNPKQLAVLRTAAVDRYAPQSLTIQGILQDMYQNFASSLQTLTNGETTAYRNHESLMETWKAELVTLQETLVKKEQAKTEAEMMLADATQGYADTESQLGTEIAFFDSTKASCQAKTDEWSQRKALRNDELSGILKALEILTDVNNRDLFERAVKPGFEMLLQLSAFQTSTPLARARGVLQAHAKQSHSLRLAALAASMQTDGRLGDAGHFDTVIVAIDALIATLKKEEAEDDKKVTDCKEQYQDIASSSQDLQWKIDNNNARITKLGNVVAASEEEKAKAVLDLETVQKETNTTRAMRVEENGRFLQAKADDEQAVSLLEQARDALAEYYANHSMNITLLQHAGAHGQLRNVSDSAPEAEFSEAGNRRAESKGIVAMITIIIEDLKSEISNGVREEEEAQLAYEKQMAALEALAKDLEKKIINLQEEIALRQAEIETEEAAKKESEGSLANLVETKNTITPGCDWFAKNQATRREKRALEMEGLQRAKDYLAGAGHDAAAALVQRRPKESGAVSFLQHRQLP